ncbi:hypothetical protein SY27_14155 [Flavobacterium sp. 316]|uniref:Ig-like domain-containing protein n=1 Tax=Flavobacterium sediminilitoris TaxID=2024526 RepID=A0ABY4HL00_9FLAO|nr:MULTISPECIES: hypothetical protein [Flavobacterium]KIX20270.1 hypothetical protein SY27_14155 [Flavobacterium sp. 316]UOX33370.1 hypothetical protein LXD69_15170 [Flavobacterium sediminilitoris]
MKKLNLNLLLVAGILSMTLWSCQKSEEVNDSNMNMLNEEQDAALSKAPAAPCPSIYALVLTSGTGTPVPGGFNSYIYSVDLCAAPVGYTYTSAIQIGGTPVTSVTGLCDMPGVPDFAWAVTGRNSNFPQSLLKVQISTGLATVATRTRFPLQDIENYGTANFFCAIQEGTSQIMRVDVSTGVCTPFAPVGPVQQYNGLTFVGNRLQVISGLTNLVCPPNSGDIFEYNLSGGPYIAKYSYKNLPSNSNYTMKELGFYFDNCCGKRWVVGSSSGIISHNLNINTCVPPNPNFLLNTTTVGNLYAIYDFMYKL